MLLRLAHLFGAATGAGVADRSSVVRCERADRALEAGRQAGWQHKVFKIYVQF